MHSLEHSVAGALVTADPDGDVAVALGERAKNVFSASKIASLRCAVIGGAADAPLKHKVRVTTKMNESMIQERRSLNREHRFCALERAVEKEV